MPGDARSRWLVGRAVIDRKLERGSAQGSWCELQVTALRGEEGEGVVQGPTREEERKRRGPGRRARARPVEGEGRQRSAAAQHQAESRATAGKRTADDVWASDIAPGGRAPHLGPSSNRRWRRREAQEHDPTQGEPIEVFKSSVLGHPAAPREGGPGPARPVAPAFCHRRRACVRRLPYCEGGERERRGTHARWRDPSDVAATSEGVY